MRVKKAVVIFLVVFSVGLVFWLYNTRQVNETSDISGRKNADTPSTSVRDYPGSSAITKAKELSSQNPRFVALRKEASQFGLTLMSWEENKYRSIRNRLFSNNKLATTLRAANQEGILVALDNKFQVNVGVVDININATDDEIITFLVDSLPAAKVRKASFEKFRKEASQFGLTLMSWEEDTYKQIRNRLLTNDKLASALKTAASEKIQVGLSHDFRITDNAVDIDVDASDEEITKFSLGK